MRIAIVVASGNGACNPDTCLDLLLCVASLLASQGNGKQLGESSSGSGRHVGKRLCSLLGRIAS